MCDAKGMGIAVINILAVIVGLGASFLWWRASRIPIDPTDGRTESGERTVALGQNISGIYTAYQRSSAINSWAAIATAAALARQAVATALDTF